jgi:transcriptional regulator GlxA family with amidase domain
MSGRPPQISQIARNKLLNAGILVVDGVYNTEFMAPYDVLQHTVYHSAPSPGVRVFTISPDGQPIKTAEGLVIEPDYSFESAPQVDILVVPSAKGSRDSDLKNVELLKWVVETGKEAHVVVSLCWGAFVLAEAGILDDHSCTTFPGDYERFATRYPHLDVQINASFVHDGRVITSQGGIRSYEAAMYLVALIYGEDVARDVGSGLLIDWPPHREPGDIFVTDSTSRME